MLDRDPQTISLDIMRVLAGIRSSLDLANTTAIDRSRSASHIRDAYLKFEAVRMTYRQNSRGTRGYSTNSILSRISDLRSELVVLVEDVSFKTIASAIEYRAMPPQKKESWSLHPDLENRRISVLDGIYLLLQSMDGINLPSVGQKQADLFATVKQLEEIVPTSQGIAPLQFQIINGRLSLKTQNAKPQKDDTANINEARTQLESDGDRILNYLNQSNCDRRIIDSVQELQCQLKSGNDIVRLGLTSIGCDLLCDRMSQEIPDAISALLKAHTVGLSMYVAQFPEWQRFSGQAAKVSLDKDDVDVLKIASDTLISRLRSSPESAEPQVASALHTIRNLTDVVGPALNKAAFALWKSIENLAIIVFQYGNTIARKTADNLADDLASAASKTIVRGLVATALAGLIYLTPISANLPGGAWLSKAVEIVQKQVQQLEVGS